MILAPGKIGFDEGLPEVLRVSLIAQLLDVEERTVRYWVTRGVPVGGHRVYLAAIKAGRRIRVSREDYYEFLRACNPDTWRGVAEAQESERKQAKRDSARLREELGGRRK